MKRFASALSVLSLSVLALSVLALLVLGGCGSSSSRTATTTTVTSTTRAGAPAGTGGPSTTASPASGGTRATATTRVATGTGSPPTVQTTPMFQLTDRNNGQTVTVPKGSIIVVVLTSTYWMFPTPPNAAVLHPSGPPVVAASPLNTCGPVGSGCGTVAMTYTATGSGNAAIHASRSVCGEAMTCGTGTGSSSGSWTVQVVVTAG